MDESIVVCTYTRIVVLTVPWTKTDKVLKVVGVTGTEAGCQDWAERECIQSQFKKAKMVLEVDRWL